MMERKGTDKYNTNVFKMPMIRPG